MENNVKWPILAGSFFLVLGLALTFERESPNLPVQAETSYTISLDSTNSPSLSTSEYVSGTLDLPQKAVQIEYTGAKRVPENHIELDFRGSISNAATTQITTIKRIDIDFSGSAYIAVSLGWNADLPRIGALYEPGVPIISDQECYYFVISSDAPNTSIQSVLITYSCVPTPPRADYTLSSDGTHYIASGYRKNPAHLVIEPTHLGLPVTEIAPEAYKGKSLLSVVIPSSIIEIGRQAFYGTSLTTITFSAESLLTTIGQEAFAYSNDFTGISLPEGLISIGEGAFKGCTGLTSVVLPSSTRSLSNDAFKGCTSLASVTLNNGLLSIGDYGFYQCPFSSIVFPSTLLSIGKYALSEMPNLSSIEIPSSVQVIDDGAFSTNYLLETATLIDTELSPSQLTYVGENPLNITTWYQTQWESGTELGTPYISFGNFILGPILRDGALVIEDKILGICKGAFSGSNISSITTQSSASALTYLGDSAFERCTLLETVSLPSSIQEVGKLVFTDTPFLATQKSAADAADIPLIYQGKFLLDASFLSSEVVIPSGVMKIGYRAFYGASGITSLLLPSTIEVIDEEAFYESAILENFSFNASNLKRIGTKAFFNSSTLTAIDLSASQVTTIEPYTFSGCSELISVSLPSTIKDIATYAFASCHKLPSLAMPSGLETIEDYAFYGSSIGASGITFPESLKTIGKYSFSGCNSLTSINFPANSVLSEINDYSFFGCSALQDIHFSGGSELLFIRVSAFYNCTLLSSVTLSDSLYSLGDTVFGNCTSLTSIVLPRNLTYIANGPFTGCASLAVINCEAPEKPQGWNSLNWNVTSIDEYGYHYPPVVWGYTGT